MASIIKTSINLNEIPKDKIIVGKKGKYLPITITINDEVDQFGNQGPVVVAQTKEERDAKNPKVYLGNVQVVWTNGDNVDAAPRSDQPTQAAAPAPAVSATVDTSGLERLISSRLDMVEDVLRMVEHRLDEGVAVSDPSADEGEGEYEDDEEGSEEGSTGDRIITASGEVVEVGGAARMMEDDQGRLVELYEAQALAANPFLVAPRSSGSGNGQSSIGVLIVVVLLLDYMSGMAVVSFI